MPSMFAIPVGPSIPLTADPRLASWDAAGHPDQLRLTAFLRTTARQIRPQLDGSSGPLALRLDVGLKPQAHLLLHHDLDNYLLPLVSHLRKETDREFVSVWATKNSSGRSSLRVEPAHPIRGTSPLHVARTTAAGDSTTYKEQVRDSLGVAPAELPAGPVELELGFTVGPSRNWINLWKPTIDALGPLLGAPAGSKPWHPHDGRIVRLGLHREVDAALGNDVVITIAAQALTIRE
jgi:hypothetical protein